MDRRDLAAGTGIRGTELNIASERSDIRGAREARERARVLNPPRIEAEMTPQQFEQHLAAEKKKAQLRRFAEINAANALREAQRLLDAETDRMAMTKLLVNEALKGVATDAEAAEVRRRLEPRMAEYANAFAEPGNQADYHLTNVIAATLEVVREERELRRRS